MLSAIIKHKIVPCTKLKRKLKEEDYHFPLEDLLTSTVFGVTKYFRPKTLYKLYAEIFKIGYDNDEYEACEKAEVLFWKVIERKEPDLMIEFRKKDKTLLRRIIVEVKWDSKKSSLDQLKDQWELFSKEDQKKSYHIYLVKDKGVGKAEIKGSRHPKKERLALLLWSDLQIRFSELKMTGEPEVKSWTDDVSELLKTERVKGFGGFKFKGLQVELMLKKKEFFFNPFETTKLNNQIEDSPDLVFFKGS